MGQPLKDLHRQKFGRLTVLTYRRTERSGATWLCLCECGATKVIAGSALRSGRTRSCSCLARGWQSTRAKVWNAVTPRDDGGRFLADATPARLTEDRAT